MSAPAPAPGQQAAPERPAGRHAPKSPSSGSLTGLGVYAVTIGVTVILAFGETMFFGGELGLITGIGLVVVSIVAAFVVRTRDGLTRSSLRPSPSSLRAHRGSNGGNGDRHVQSRGCGVLPAETTGRGLSERPRLRS